MKKLLASLLAFVTLSGPAFALSDSAIPTKVPTTWAQSAPGGNSTCPIPIPSQISITPGRASWTDGFPPVTFLPLGSGGVPPFGADFNGVFCQLSQWTRWLNAGGPIPYDATFQSAIGGYPSSALIASVVNPFHYWLSKVDNNGSNPDTGGANWTDFYLASASALWAAGSGGTGNAQTITIVGWTQDLPGIPISFIPTNVNTGAATLSISGLAPRAIMKKSLTGVRALSGGELLTTQIATVQFDGGVYELISSTVVRANLISFQTSGTYTPSAGLAAVEVTCIGGGGAGGGAIATAAQQASAGGGGSGGSVGIGIFTPAQVSPSVAVTIGAGGTPNLGSAGNGGQPTSFGSLINVPGGGGGSSTAATGLNSASATGVAGNSGSVTAPIQIRGALAQQGVVINFTNGQTSISGSGGPGLFNSPGGAGITTSSAGLSGNTGTGFGSGGGGAANGASQSNLNGGQGSAGACIVKELIVQ